MTSPTIDFATAMSSVGVSPAELLFSDMHRELTTTRHVLERVPDGQNDWRPHEKSMKLGSLATHLAELPNFASLILTTDELDWAKNPYQPAKIETTAERLALFDRRAAAMKTAVAAAEWPELGKRWTMRIGNQIIVDDQKAKLLRTLCLSHIAHHRAQLGVYLRLLGVAVPSVYGPSADES
jgi:uncharacterized damage-inducible protein DinB